MYILKRSKCTSCISRSEMDVDDCSVHFIQEFIFRIYNIITRQEKPLKNGQIYIRHQFFSRTTWIFLFYNSKTLIEA